MNTDKFALIVGLVLIVLLALLGGARKFLAKYAPTTKTTKDDEWLERITRIESILEGIQATVAKAEEPAKADETKAK